MKSFFSSFKGVLIGTYLLATGTLAFGTFLASQEMILFQHAAGLALATVIMLSLSDALFGSRSRKSTVVMAHAYYRMGVIALAVAPFAKDGDAYWIAAIILFLVMLRLWKAYAYRPAILACATLTTVMTYVFFYATATKDIEVLTQTFAYSVVAIGFILATPRVWLEPKKPESTS